MSARLSRTVTVPVGEALKTIHLDIRVTGMWRMRGRVWLAMKFLRLGAWIMPCQAEVTMGHKETGDGK